MTNFGPFTLHPIHFVISPFLDAREFVRKLGLKSSQDWRKYCKSGRKPSNIPANPERTYGEEWKGWGYWLRTGRIANQNDVFLRSYRIIEWMLLSIINLHFNWGKP